MVSAIASDRMSDGGTRIWRHVCSATMRLAALALTAFVVAAPATAGCDDDDRPATPISLKANPLGSGGIMLQWSSNVGHYDIYIRDKLGRPVREAPDIVGGATNENYHEFYGLEPDKEYFFSMRARSEGGTQGCISKNASETVKAKTDAADTNDFCSRYAKDVMAQIQQMKAKQCKLPGNPYSGVWAEREGSQFLACLEQRRAGLPGYDTAQWVRNQDIQACKERAKKCTKYRNSAVYAAIQNRIYHCGYSGARWTFNGAAHYSWCMGLSADSALPVMENVARSHRIIACKTRKASSTQGNGGTTGTGTGTGTCTGPPEEWTDMLKAHNDLRAQYCGAPLTWDCNLASQSQSYAEDCILDQHGASGENMADEWGADDSYPAVGDAKAFEDVWGCEKDEFHFDQPEIVGGFKEDCHKGKNGQKPVNGHFTQIVWLSNKSVGCGRAKCAMKDDQGKIHQGTHWVCRYSPGGNDPGALAENVRKPPCTNAFHSLPVRTCFGGMVQTESGDCRCPPGQHWRGHRCSEDSVVSRPPPVGSSEAPATGAPVGSGEGPRTSPPPVSSGEGSRTSPPVCMGNRPIGVYPNCCPTGTFFSDGMCRTGGGGANGVNPGGDKTCHGRRPVGVYPHCCPVGTSFQNGVCVGRTNQPTTQTAPGSTTSTGPCTGGRIGRPPHCHCPAGTSLQNGTCVTATSPPTQTAPGSSTQPNTPARPCTGGRIGRPPYCHCPAGTNLQNGTCVRPASPASPPAQTPPGSTTQPSTPAGTCTGGRIGRPPHCRCPSGTRYLANRCRPIPTTKPNAPCPDGLKGPNCDQVIVK